MCNKYTYSLTLVVGSILFIRFVVVATLYRRKIVVITNVQQALIKGTAAQSSVRV